jgi:hypothetical protein
LRKDKHVKLWILLLPLLAALMLSLGTGCSEEKPPPSGPPPKDSLEKLKGPKKPPAPKKDSKPID